MEEQLLFYFMMKIWGVGKIYTYGKAVAASDWEGVKDSKKKQIHQEVDKLSTKIRKEYQYTNPSIKVKVLFFVMRFIQKSFHLIQLTKNIGRNKVGLGKGVLGGNG